MRATDWLLLLLLLILFAGQAALSSPQKSAAFDEEYHLTRGYAYLRTGDLRMNTAHPPLINILAAAPLLARNDVTLPLDHPTWLEGDYFRFADVFTWQVNGNPQRLLEWARWPIILLGTTLAAALFFWARAMFGAVAGWAALLLAVFDPNLLTNARLVTTDLGLTLFFALAFYALWRWIRDPGWTNLVLVGLAAGAATAAKYTGLMVWPALFLVVLLHPQFDGRRRRAAGRLLLMGVVGYALLWAVYGFQIGPLPELGLSIPIPAADYPQNVWNTFVGIEEEPKTAYLLGETSARGWWYYFWVTLAVKSPLPLLLLAGAALLLVARRRWRESAVLWLPALLFMALATTSRVAIGYRHILPVVPFLIMLASGAVHTLWERRSRQRAVAPALALLLVWQIAGTVRLFPHQEAFFNVLAGGASNGHKVLVDSNLDWGQDLIQLRQLLAERDIDEVNLAYFGTGYPERYGLSYKPLPSFLRFVSGPEIEAYNPYTPAPGWYAISLTSLHMGLFYQNLDLYAYFRNKEPVAHAGYSINLYRVDYTPDTPVSRTVVTGRSVSDIPAEELGIRPGERRIVKWRASPSTTISWSRDAGLLLANATRTEANFDDAFRLLGYRVSETVIRPGKTLTATLYWEMGSGELATPAPAAAAPLAAYVHLSGDDPSAIVSQYDGWEAALRGLEEGDLIGQRVTLKVPVDTVPDTYFLRAGLYSPQSGERVSLRGHEEDFITLAMVTIENGP